MIGSVLIVDDERQLTEYLARILAKKGFDVALAHNASEARRMMASRFPDVAIIDLKLPDADGLELMRSLIPEYPQTGFIVVTAYGSIKSAVESTRLGALDYLTKPFEPEELILTIRNALRSEALKDEVRRLRSQLRGSVPPSRSPGGTGGAPYPSAAMRETLELASRAAKQDGIVLLLGESGSGKDYLARMIHRASSRAEGPFFFINCAAVAREIAESELFGHEPGAFTGTRGRKRGMLELAREGTIFLDEIGEMDLALQAKLLSFLDTRTFMRVGGERPISIDTRIIAATNRDLFGEVEAGRFRKDLFYRINVMPIVVPPLRERKEDLPRLVEEMLAALTSGMRASGTVGITEAGMAKLATYSWPGNVRELRNVLERALISCDGDRIDARDLNLPDESGDWSYLVRFPEEGKTLQEVTRETAREVVSEALRRSGSKSAAARLLGISRHSLNYQLRVLGLTD